jgi:transcriptional regulator with XRE-family HTH domain
MCIFFSCTHDDEDRVYKKTPGGVVGRRERVERGLVGAVRERLRTLLLEAYGGTQRRLAEALRARPILVSRWLNPRLKVLPSATELYRISRETGWSVDWLLFGKGPKQRGGAPSDGSLGAQLRSYLLRHQILDEISGIEILDGPQLATYKETSIGPPVDLLPSSDEDLLLDTVGMWTDWLSRQADTHLAYDGLAKRFPDKRSPTGGDRLLEAYQETQGAVREARRRDLDLAFRLAAAGASVVDRKAARNVRAGGKKAHRRSARRT